MALRSLAGFFLLALLAWIFSENRRRIPIRVVVTGLALQIGLALLLLRLPFFARIFAYLNNVVLALEASTRAGTSFVFGYVGSHFL